MRLSRRKKKSAKSQSTNHLISASLFLVRAPSIENEGCAHSGIMLAALTTFVHRAAVDLSGTVVSLPVVPSGSRSWWAQPHCEWLIIMPFHDSRREARQLATTHRRPAAYSLNLALLHEELAAWVAQPLLVLLEARQNRAIALQPICDPTHSIEWPNAISIGEQNARKPRQGELYQPSWRLTRLGFPNQLHNDLRWQTEGRLPWELPFRFGRTIRARTFVGWRHGLGMLGRHAGCWRSQRCLMAVPVVN